MVRRARVGMWEEGETMTNTKPKARRAVTFLNAHTMTPSRPRATSFARVRNTRAPLSDVARNLKAQLAFAQPFSSRPPRPAGLLALAPAIDGGDVDGDGEPAKG